jgi:hypothetical protein
VITAPDAAMLDQKFFVSRLDQPVPDLYERWWDGVEWTWVDHGDPESERMLTAPGAAMLDERAFVVTETGSLWERSWDGAAWNWQAHGRPANQRITQAPGAAILNEKLFVVTETGNLWERHWRAAEGTWAWQDHGFPANQRITRAPGAAMHNEKLFVVTETGNLWDRHWEAAQGAWAWQDHGRPANQRITQAPGAAMMDEKLFVVTETGNLWERHWRAAEALWAWQDHLAPPTTRAATAPGAAIMNAKLFVAADNAHMFERFWTGEEWKWVDHGTAFHDQAAHVIGAPGREPAITVAVMGDGFAESDMADYRSVVADHVVTAFGLDQLGPHRPQLRLVRIDVASPVEGVTERRYDEHGTDDTAADDTLTSEDFKFSRLGYIGTGVWSHCWIETSDRTNPRVASIWRRFAPQATKVIVVVNSATTGGCSRGDIAAFTRGERSEVIAHEMGHALFGLGDEYHVGTGTFKGTAGQPNLSELPMPWALLKWGDLDAPGAPLPTLETALPAGWNARTSVGAFEGGGADFATGIFRPVTECRMNQNDPPWCPVCGRAIDRVFGGL